MRNIKKYFLTTLCCLTFILFAQANKGVKGTVTDVNGKPLEGVRITRPGEIKGTYTNSKGEFNYIVESVPLILEFKASGFCNRSVDFKDDESSKNIILKPENEMQDVAYGQQKKESVSASVFTISGEELLESRSSNLFIALQGRLPGLRITQSSGEPGNESFSKQIRGFDSPNSSSVMFLVDGVERDPSGVDFHDIESVTVMRDAAATAMFGMRASGGALLIKTKTGFNGKSKINVSFDYSMQSPTRVPDIVSAYDYANMYNQRVANDTLYADAQSIASGGVGLDQSSTVFYTQYELDRYKNADNTEFYPVRDMIDDFMKDFSKKSNLNINFQGGTDKMKYYTSVGYMYQGGLFETEKFDEYSYDSESKTNRFNFRSNLDIKLNDNLNGWVKIGGYMEKNNRPYIGSGQGWDYVLAKLYETPNNAYNDLTPDGEVLVKRDKLNFRNTKSVYDYLNRSGSENKTETHLGNTFGARQKLDGITDGLSVMGQITFDVLSRSTQIRSRSSEKWEVVTLTDSNGLDSLGYAKIAGTSNSTLSDSQSKYFNYIYDFRGSIDYQHNFGEKHGVSASLIGDRHMRQNQGNLESNYIGLSGRFNYSYKNRYFAEFNGAYQGSEQFAKGKRYGFFPSLSAAWIVSKESFMQNIDFVDFLKIRGSVGRTGNSVFTYGGDYQYLYITTWTSSASEDQIGNPNISWELSTKYDLGIETKLFNSLYMTADYFYHKNTDVIVYDIETIPDGMMGLGSGATLPPANNGETTNHGFEITVDYNKKINKDWTLIVDGNISFNHNEIKEMEELPYDDSYAYSYRQKGYAYGYHWGYKTDGLFNDQSDIDNWADQSALGGYPIPGDIKYKDLTGDGVVDEKDKAPLAPSYAECHYGLNFQVNYKWLDLKVFVTGQAKRNLYLSGFGRWSNRDNFTEYMKNAWTSENPTSDSYPRLGNNTTNYIKSDYWIKNGSFLRLRNVELGYTLPKSFLKKINASSVRVYVNGLNLLTFDHLPNDDIDPESNNALSYPIFKAYNLGVSVKF